MPVEFYEIVLLPESFPVSRRHHHAGFRAMPCECLAEFALRTPREGDQSRGMPGQGFEWHPWRIPPAALVGLGQ